MINANMVNGGPACHEHAHFCVIFAVSGRFLRFKNPVKYICPLELTVKTVHSLALAESVKQNFRLYS
jgi:hypothetical protein